MKLSDYTTDNFERGKPRLVEFMWIILSSWFVSSKIPGTAHRKLLLRVFGAKIGKGGCIKPGVRVKFPWRLVVGDHSWIGEDVWIDNLAQVQIGNNCCISQGSYFCTGSHSWSEPRFNLKVFPITVEDCAWIAAKASVGPGVVVGQGAVLTLGSVATRSLARWTVYSGVPARVDKVRFFNNEEPRARTL